MSKFIEFHISINHYKNRNNKYAGQQKSTLVKAISDVNTDQFRDKKLSNNTIKFVKLQIVI